MKVYAVFGCLLLMAYLTTVDSSEEKVTTCQSAQTLCLGIAIDASGSIGKIDFQKNLNVVRQIGKAVPKGSYLAVSTFGTRPRSVCHTTDNIERCLKAVDKATYQSSTTRTDRGIDDIVSQLKKCPENVLRRMIVFTDGKSTQPDLTKISAGKAKSGGIVSQVVGVGKTVDDLELQAIASSSEGVYKFSNYQVLVESVDTLIQGVCTGSVKEQCQTVCLGVAIDASGSIGKENFPKNLKVVRQIGEAVPKESYLAVSTFGTRARSVCHTTNDIPECLKAVDVAYYQSSTTRTDRGIDAIVSELKKCPKNTFRLMIVFTDGKSTQPALTKVSASKAKKEGILCQAIGVGSGVSDSELHDIASSSNDVYKVKNYQALAESVDILIKSVCNAKST